MSNESDNAGEENNCTVFVKPRIKKKMKSDNLDSDANAFEEFRSEFVEGNTEIDYNTFCQFLIKSKGKQDIITVANELNLGLDSLLKTLIISSKKATTNNLRSRLKRIIKKIKMNDKRDSLQYDSDISLSQDYSSDHSESSINLAAEGLLF
ncbi:hypothetical protein QE152_g37461 [Popillia japonica]|uniref:Uncharacterized protein n=1 Tax=Popillia japonica TaxID=7064 RepID=A0AAW1IA63_POPJA